MCMSCHHLLYVKQGFPGWSGSLWITVPVYRQSIFFSSYFSGFSTKANRWQRTGKDEVDLRPTGCTGGIVNDYVEWVLDQKYGKLQREDCYRSESEVRTFILKK